MDLNNVGGTRLIDNRVTGPHTVTRKVHVLMAIKAPHGVMELFGPDLPPDEHGITIQHAQVDAVGCFMDQHNGL